MIKRIGLLLAFLLLSSALFAAPVITSISPTTAPVTPGTHVTIKGTGFSSCIICSPPTPPQVLFGGTPADSVRLIDSETIDAVTPAHLPASVHVTVKEFDNTFAISAQTITFTGDPLDAFERILIPIFMPPVHGAFGSEFRTIVRASNRTDETTARMYGVDLRCLAIMPVMDPLTDPIEITPDGLLAYREIPPDCSNSVGLFVYVPKTQAKALTLNDRVLDVSRSALSNGTEIPIVRSSEFTSGRTVLLGIPIDGRFRSTLRIYAAQPITVRLTTVGTPRDIQLQPGRTIFEPAYASFTDFPIPVDPGSEGQTMRITIDGPPGPAGPSPMIPGLPFWAFVTVTNNETQQITTITPDN